MMVCERVTACRTVVTSFAQPVHHGAWWRAALAVLDSMRAIRFSAPRHGALD
jgi:hypothetical protein